MGDDTCACGHVLDEHGRDHACAVEGCGCVHYEHDPNARSDHAD